MHFPVGHHTQLGVFPFLCVVMHCCVSSIVLEFSICCFVLDVWQIKLITSLPFDVSAFVG